ncbi:MAG: glutathione S-transferase [Solirubrobacteraceae bacterium]|nr:glutathione S-transferase [Solirubrobacteraceae bacterium]
MAPPLKLYSVPASHPAAAVEAALRLKGIEYKRVDLPNLSQRVVVRMVAGGGTVPAIKFDGQALVGSRPIMRRLDELKADPPLFPADPERRAAVEAAEEWGDEVLQRVVRRITIHGVKRAPAAAALSLVPDDAQLPLPKALQRFFAPPVVAMSARINNADEKTVKEDLRALPGHLDKVDAWIAEGVLGGDIPNAADLQIGSSLRLLNRVHDVRPLLAGRPCMVLAERYFPPHQGDIPAGTYPAEWLPAAG